MILADTSAWVEFDRATGSAVHQRVAELIAGDVDLAVTEPVTASDFDSAARIYRRCRAAGITPRGMVDCMIAAVAWRHGAALLAQDVDLVRVCQTIGIDLDQASVRS